MTALTRTEIVNLALREVGASRVDDWNEASPEAVIARDMWTQAVRKALARHEWQFAMTTAELARASATPAARYLYRYTLPGNFVRLATVADNDRLDPVLDEGQGFVIRNGSLEASAERVFIDYVYDAPSIGTWPPWFIDVLTADYASVMASPLKSATERARLEQLAEKRLREGRGIDSVQQQVQRIRPGSWRMAAKGAWRS
jgi:hypothetical protein